MREFQDQLIKAADGVQKETEDLLDRISRLEQKQLAIKQQRQEQGGERGEAMAGASLNLELAEVTLILVFIYALAKISLDVFLGTTIIRENQD